MRHVKVGDRLVLREQILEVDISELEDHYRVKVYIQGSVLAVLEDQQALDLVMELKPSAFEGKRFRWAKGAWAFHNLVAHPALQVLAWCGLHKLGFRIHDATVPKPRCGNG